MELDLKKEKVSRLVNQSDEEHWLICSLDLGASSSCFRVFFISLT